MNICNPVRVANWNDWANAQPVDPLMLIANAQISSIAGTDIGVYQNSLTFAVPTPSSIPTPEIIGVSIASSFSGQVLTNMPVPVINLLVNQGQAPNQINVTFSSNPDPSSVTTSSFKVTLSGSPVSGSISFPSPNIARFTSSSPLTAGTYTITLFGTGSSEITFSGGSVLLDGEPFQLPSGNGVPGGNFIFSLHVVSAVEYVTPPAVIGGWNPTLFALNGLPVCNALGTDELQNVADANQWTFLHSTANPTVAPVLANTIFLRCGRQWQMSIPLTLGSLNYPSLQLSFRFNAGTSGGQYTNGKIPVISFAARNYTGSVNLVLTLIRLGEFIMGFRAIDSRGNYFMYETNTIIVP